MSRRTVCRLTTVIVATAAMSAAASAPAHAAGVLAVHSLPTIIGNITTWVVGIALGVATLFAAIGGLRMLMAGGDPGEVDKARSALKSALVGYALALLAPVLLGIVRSWIGG